MRLATRTFLFTFLPLVGLLLGSFWALRARVVQVVRQDLRASVRRNQLAMAAERSRDQIQAGRVLAILSENPVLKSGMELMIAEQGEARTTVEDQLTELAESLGFEVLLVSSPDGRPLAAVMRGPNGLRPLPLAGRAALPTQGFFSARDQIYQLSSGPINQGDENLGTLTIGERFDLARFDTPMLLLDHGAIAASSVKALKKEELESVAQKCGAQAECEISAAGNSYFSVAMDSSSGTAQGYVLRSLQNIDLAGAPMDALLRDAFLLAGGAALAATLGISLTSSISVSRPISELVRHLKASEQTGLLTAIKTDTARIHEIRELAKGFNRAADAVQGGREALVKAYVEFTGSLANALDARDAYTAGHSRRVSEYSCAIAHTMGITGTPLADLRIGALLHDLGKIGISDSVLLKPGRLTPEEESLIRQHPVIGRRILEGVHGFQAYLDIVELHHENWDGSGYPRGLKGEQTPLLARIVKVADAYDALTSDRPYRKGMTHDAAIAILQAARDTQFESPIVEALCSNPDFRRMGDPVTAPTSLQNLSDAVQPTPARQEVV